MDAAFEKILKKIAELDENFEIKSNQLLIEDLDIDSLRLIDLVLQIEGEYEIELNEDALANARTVEALWVEITRAKDLINA
ncbi:acyl carrier protein [Chitinibacter sp. ZOR0017]|uniref:acyl carrier protein n=1 Tax=Chitinibacter sp. ZOR0017 TaxID=1339254 RepID=UPI000646821A|nr:phosphopantetheine-binding protein [Chitinibacter sp. ZOR0017]